MDQQVYYFDFNSGELDEIIDLLRDGLALRPAPEGRPFHDLETALAGAGDYFEELRRISRFRGRLSGNDLLDLAKEMVRAYHRLWSSPFPTGLATGQILFSAILERPMRDLLHGLTALRDDKSTDHEPLLQLDAEVEVRCFAQWYEALPDYRRSVPRLPSFGYGSLAASFLLGWWFGSFGDE